MRWSNKPASQYTRYSRLWEDQSGTYFPDANGGSGTFGFQSSDANNKYTAYATAPGTQNDGTSCSGNCDTTNGYFQSSTSLPELTQ